MQAKPKDMSHKPSITKGLISSGSFAEGELFSVGYEIEETMENDIQIKTPQPMAGNDDRHRCSTLRLPDPANSTSSGTTTSPDSKYQLTLRVDDATHRYLTDLAHKAEAETVSELVRMSLRALEDALHKYERIERADGLVVSLSHPAEFEGENNLATLRTAPTRRINVVLREAAHQRLNRLLHQLNGLTLVDLVMTAVGVIDANLRDDHSETKANECCPTKSARNTKGGRLKRVTKQQKEVA